VLLLFNASLFLDLCDDEIRGKTFRHWLKNSRLSRLCNTERYGQTARKYINPVHEIDSKSISLLYDIYGLFLLWCCIYLPVWQFVTVPSVENFATSQNWLFIAEVCNTVWCGQIGNIWNNLSSFWWYHSLNFQCPSYLAVIQFLKQVTTKSCRTMQLLESSLKFHDVVTPVCITM